MRVHRLRMILKHEDDLSIKDKGLDLHIQHDCLQITDKGLQIMDEGL